MRNIRIVLFLLLFSLLYGCGTAHIRTDIQLQDLDRYKNVLIQDVKVYSNEAAAKTNMPLQKKLKDWELYSRGQLEECITSSRYRLIESLEGVGDETLVVSLDVNVQYGNRALRWAVGFGAGKGGVVSRLTIRDAKTGEVKYKSQANSDLSMGGAGGDIGKVLEVNIRKLIEQYKSAEFNKAIHPTSG